MNVREASVYALLGLGVVCEVVACLGVVAMRGIYDRLHYVAPSTLGVILVAAAIWIREGPSMIALQGTLLSLFMVVAAPALAHGTARAARISDRGDWRLAPGEGVEAEDR